MWKIIPCLIFLGLGALTNFGPMIANPKTMLLFAAAQLGVYFAFLLPWRPISLCQEGSTQKERALYMKPQLREVSTKEKIIFPIAVSILSILFVPIAARVVQTMGQKANSRNFLLMHAMDPNVSGATAATIAGGVFLSIIG